MSEVVKVAEFGSFLVNRNSLQGNGKCNGEQFRSKYLSNLEKDTWWNDSSTNIILDFSGVDTLGPSWANEVFAYYTDIYTPAQILKKIVLVGLSRVKSTIIETELEAGYRG